ncbi:hypothetical protein BWI17_21730 [Betaproteobacteria bacterium GR16-43]|nr:hypothetical protein BWI17_21730 [Betaproteobacteria bacterium GR16-43]
MWLDAILAYLHFTAVFVFFAFLSIEAWLLRSPVFAARAGELLRADAWYWGATAAVLVTGLARLFLGAKGEAFYLHAPLYVKLALFAAAAGLSLAPSATFRRWVREAAQAQHWTAPESERVHARRRMMLVVHVAAAIPLAAVLMARGLP